jgi:predicted nucleotidyltransferase
VTIHGSQAYGLNNELSDVDVKGICIPPKEVENNLFHKFEQAENNPLLEESLAHLKNPKNPKFESTVYSLKKFLGILLVYALRTILLWHELIVKNGRTAGIL